MVYVLLIISIIINILLKIKNYRLKKLMDTMFCTDEELEDALKNL